MEQFGVTMHANDTDCCVATGDFKTGMFVAYPYHKRGVYGNKSIYTDIELPVQF